MTSTFSLNKARHILKRLLPNGYIYQLQQRRLEKLIAAFPRRVVEHNYSGHRLKVLIADNLAEGWYDRDNPLDKEIEFLRTARLRRGARVFDLGAHQAVFAMILASEVGDEGLVIAVEGNAHNAAVARTNVELNNFSNIKIIHAVLTDQAGKDVLFQESLNGQVSTNSCVGRKIASTTIDELATTFGPPDVVVIDVEGYEAIVMKGGEKTLRSTADWMVEVHVGCGLEKFGNVGEILHFFPNDRFELFIAAGESQRFEYFKHGATPPHGKFFLAARPVQ